MTRLTESAIENFAIKLFERLGYAYLYGPDIAPDGEYPERSHYAEVLLVGRFGWFPSSSLGTPILQAPA
ncbi:MAG: hypothetical protein NTX45_12170 [Proteobacteria bacterium]|nr:hypothetical protein [Pseudomonadota bacterium]